MPFALAIVVAVTCLGGCLGDDDSQSAAGEATHEKLLEAYSTLEAAASDVPEARLPPRLRGETETIEAGGDFHSSKDPPKHQTALLDYFGEHRVAFGLAILRDGPDPGPALSAIEFHDAPQDLTLIVPPSLRRGTAGELIAGGATFAAMSADGQIHCIDDEDSGVRPCPAPDLPNP